MEIILKFLGIFLGVFSRLLLPYLRKLYKGQIKKFGKRYLIITFGSLILSFIITLVIFPKLSNELKIISWAEGFKLFSISFGFGFGFNSIIIEIANWLNITEK